MDAASAQKMTIMEHLEELRKRLIYCVIALVIGLIPCLFFTQQIFQLLMVPAPAGFTPVYTEMTEMLFTYFKVALLGGACLAMPVLVYQVLSFIAPALMPNEKRYLFMLMPGVVILFIAGLAFSYFVLLPFAVKYLLTFSGVADPMIKIGNYISFVTSLLFWLGAAFETPLIIFFLAKIGLVNRKSLAKIRKYAVVGVFVISAVITPTPDPMNQILVAVPLYILFELGVQLTRFAKGSR
jgi:sec-independent protein translocase protein TatC